MVKLRDLIVASGVVRKTGTSFWTKYSLSILITLANVMVSFGQTNTPSVSPASGEKIENEFEGWELRKPLGWKHVESEGKTILGHDSEAGIIMIDYFDGMDLVDAQEEIAMAINDYGEFQFSDPIHYRFITYDGLILEMTLTGEDGSSLQVRTDLVKGNGGVFSVIGITTADHFKNLRNRVDAIALSTLFKEPKRGNTRCLNTCFRYSGGYSAKLSNSITTNERTLIFDGKGNFKDSSFVGASAGTIDRNGTQTSSSTATRENASSGRYKVINDEQVEIYWPDGGVSLFELVWEHGSVTAFRSGKIWYFLCD